jgi:hypothetical protein
MLTDFVNDVIIDAGRLSEFKIVLISRRFDKAESAFEKIWSQFRNLRLDSKMVDSTANLGHGHSILLKNGSRILTISLEGGNFHPQAVKADQLYCFKADEFTHQEKIKVLIPFLSLDFPRIPLFERMKEV